MRGGLTRCVAIVAAIAAAACTQNNVVVGTVTIPAEAGPGQTGFGYGSVGLVTGSGDALPAASSVLVAATSDAAGPSETAEGDSLWRIRGGMLEFCEWRADGRDDCRLAGYEGWDPTGGGGALLMGVVAFFPTILKTTSASEIAIGKSVGAGPFISSPSVLRVLLNDQGTPPLDATQERAIWISSASSTTLGPQPAFLCVADPLPTCRSLPFMVANVVSVLVVAKDGRRVPVLWAQGGALSGTGIGAVIENLGVFRCESLGGKPHCEQAKEIQ